MTPVLLFAHAACGLVLLLGSRLADAMRERLIRAVAALGISSGLGLFLWRGSLQGWRGIAPDPEAAAVAGLAIACAWALVISLDLESDRWWTGALVGVAATGALAVVGGAWVALVVIYLIVVSAAFGVAVARSRNVGWLTLAVADAGLAAALLSDALARSSWRAPTEIEGLLAIPLVASAALRAGAIPRLGPWATLHTPSAALMPIAVGLGAGSVIRWAPLPNAAVASTVLVVALSAAAWTLLRRVLDPSILGTWAVAGPAALMLVSPRAPLPAACAMVLAATLVCLWPDAVERGRVSRGTVLSGVLPTVTFAATAIATRAAFAEVTAAGDTGAVVAWLTFSALLPVFLAAGVALGVSIGRSEQSGGYHPEAVFTTWLVLGGSVGVAFLTGSDSLDALGGGPAFLLFVVALALGGVAAWRSGGGFHPQPATSARVFLGAPPHLGTWAAIVALVVQVVLAAGASWFVYRGLEVGFL